MARDATARLYDVDEDSLVFKKLGLTKTKYDHATISFRAKRGKLVGLDKLHESVWATRLSGGTRSGVVRLDVTIVGKVVKSGKETVLVVSGSDKRFVLDQGQDEQSKAALVRLRSDYADSGKLVSVTGQVAGWAGVWPKMLSKPLPPPRIMVASHQEAQSP